MDEQSIFLEALEQKTPEARVAWLAKACGNDSPLRARIEALVARHFEASRFLQRPPVELEATISPGDAIVGSAGHSVLTSLGQSMPVPRVNLREAAEDAGAVVQPKPAEMPQRDSDSRFQLQGEIARGGMGAILKGRDTDLGRDLAIKVLLDQHKDRPEVIQRFIEEAQIGGQLQHPGIAPIYELGQFLDKRPFFAMKLVKGETLAKILAHRAEPSTDRGRFIGIFEQVCQTMAYAHSRGVIHRDLKPANIMVGAFGEVQVMDWGLAKVLAASGNPNEKKSHQKQSNHSVIQTLRSTGSDSPAAFGSAGSQTQMGSVMGTPAYMPPEQALGEIDNLDERADVFGLGAILCEILTGKPPYVAEDGTRVFRMASRGDLSECFARLDQCGADTELVVLAKHCLELEPQDRPRNAGALAERVSKYVASVETKLRATETEAAVQAERLEQQQRSARKLQKMIAGLVVVSLLAIGTSIVAGKFWKDADTSRRVATKEAINAKEQRDLAQKNLEKADAAEKVALKERDAARQAQLDALDQTYLATRDEIRALRFARQAGWRSAALERVQRLVQLGSRNLDLVDLRTEALACVAEMDVQPQASLPSGFSAWHIAYSPDQSALAIDSGERVAIYDLYTNREISSIPSHIRAPFAFHPSGALAVPNGTGRIHFHPIRAGQTTIPEIVGQGDAMALALSQSGDRIAVVWGSHGDAKTSASIQQVEVFLTATGESIWKKELTPRHEFAYKVAVALSPDGSMLATHGLKHGVNLYTVGSDEPPIELGKLDNRLCAVSFHPGGQLLAAAGIGFGVVWDLQSRVERYRIHAPVGGLWDMAFSPDGQMIGSVTNDGIARFWDSRAGRELLTVKTETQGNCLSIAFSPTGSRFASGGGSVRIFDIEGRRECRNDYSATNDIYALSFDRRQESLLASGGAHVSHRWKLSEPVANGTRSILGRHPVVLRASPDGRQFAQGFGGYSKERKIDFSIAVWLSGDSAAERSLVGPQEAVRDIAFDNTGRTLAATSADGHLYVWDFETGVLQKTIKLDAGPIHFLDDNQFVAASQNRLLIVSAKEGTVSREVGLLSPIQTLVVTPDKREVLVGTKDGSVHRVQISDLVVAQSRMVLEQPSKLLMAISSNGKIVSVTAQAGARSVFISPHTLEPLAQLPSADQRLNAIEFDPDGQYFALGGDQIALWDLDLVGADLMKLGLGFGCDDSDQPESWLIKANRRTYTRTAKAKILAAAATVPGALKGLGERTANDPEAQFEIGKLYAKQGNLEQADIHFAAARVLYRQRLQQAPENLSFARDLLEVMLPPVKIQPLVSTLDNRGDLWRHTTEAPDKNWIRAEFDDSNWKVGRSPFGTSDFGGRQGAWETPEIWLRHDFALPEGAKLDALYQLRLMCDDSAEVYLNGELLVRQTKSTSYRVLTFDLEPSVQQQLRHGKNTLAVHCANPNRTGYIDVGLYAVPDAPAALSQKRLAATKIADPWIQLAVAYQIHGDQTALEELLVRHPAASVVVGDLYMIENDWKRAAETYSKSITPETKDTELLLKRAQAYEKLGEWALVQADWRRIVAAHPEKLQSAFDKFKRDARWNEAAEFALQRVQFQPGQAMTWLGAAPVMALADDQAAYDDFCRRALENFAASKDSADCERVLKACLLRSKDVDLIKRPKENLFKLIDEGTLPKTFLPWAWGTRALVEYRSGDYEAASKSVAKSEELNPSSLAHAFNLALRALAQHQLGQHDTARQTRDECALAIQRLQAMGDTRIDHDFLIAEILLREAEAVAAPASR
jgi:serine/threonine protein kinase/WD40 repeat protein/tetratricopeptide (TPR) repeat protein